MTWLWITLGGIGYLTVGVFFGRYFNKTSSPNGGASYPQTISLILGWPFYVIILTVMCAVYYAMGD
jgi:hypothetical protein